MKTLLVLSALACLAAMAVIPISSKMIPPFPCDKLDVMMLIDRTESVGPKVLEQVKALARKILHRLYVAPIQTRLIVASFGHDAQYLNGQAFRDWNAGRSIRIERLIEDLEGLHNRTNLDEGLKLAFDVYGRKEIKERNFAPNVMIVFTDGKTFDREQVFKVWKTKPDDLYIIAASVGKKSKIEENRKVLDRVADIVINGTLEDGSLDESLVFDKILELFNFTPCEKNQPACLSVGEFGCFKTKFSSPFGEKFAISPLEDKDCWLLTKPSLNRDQAFERCSWCSWKKGFFLFGLDGKGNCYAGNNASSFYNGGHPSPDNCNSGDKIGGNDSNLVFYLKDCQALGMENHVISDEQITASSQESSSIRGPGRLNSLAGWTARFSNDNQWLQIDLGMRSTKVTRIATQGFGSKWVTKFEISYSNFRDAEGNLKNSTFKKLEKFNSDANTVVENRVNFMAQYVRFHPLQWYPRRQPPSMRVELYDCSRDLAPKVSYGSIGCLKSGYEGMTRIDNEELNRMPGNSRLEKCAWAARIKQASLFTFVDGVCKYRKVFRKMKAISVSQDCANKDQVFFVSNTAQWLMGRKRRRDIAVIVDIQNEDVHYLATIADALDVSSSGIRVGIVAVKGLTFKIDLKFNESAASNETELLAKIKDAGKANEGNYSDAMNSVDELFTQINGDRRDFDDSLLIITDKSTNFVLGGDASLILNNLKAKGVDVVVAGIQSVDQQSQSAFEDMATSSNFGVIVPNAHDAMPAFYYTRAGSTAILKALTMLP